MRSQMVVLVILVMAASACGSEAEDLESASAGAAPAMSSAPSATVLLEPADFAASIAEPSRFTVNVHVPDEGAISGTDAAIPYDRIDDRAADLPRDTGTPLAVYCKSGRMSALAGVALRQLGYTDIVELEGGMDAWSAEGYSALPAAP